MTPAAVGIVVENLPVPPDRRVWQEARALNDAGYHVSVISPKGLGFVRSYEILDGIEVYRYHNWESKGTLLGYIVEYGWALIAEFLLAIRIYSRTRFRILQACNPPDTIFLIALFFKLFGVRFILDYHDPNPELYALKFSPNGFLYWLVCFAERLSFKTANVVITTNSSGRDIAVSRGKVSPNCTFVVQTCPELNELRPECLQPELKEGRKYIVVYVGIMGPQDGVDLLLESIECFVNQHDHSDTLFILIGPGSELPRLQAISVARNLGASVKFTGPLYGDDLRAYLATADVGVAPDPSNALNDKLTMIKIFEYMSYGLPVVLFDLVEGRRTAGDAALYAKRNDPADFAAQITKLLDSDSLRRQLGLIGRMKIKERLNWEMERSILVKAYQVVLGREPAALLQRDLRTPHAPTSRGILPIAERTCPQLDYPNSGDQPIQ